MIRGDNELGEIFCAGTLCNGNGVPVQTIRMTCAPYIKKGQSFRRFDVREENVPLCEKDYVDFFPARSKWIPGRFLNVN